MVGGIRMSEVIDRRKLVRVLFYLIIFLLCIFFLLFKATKASYETNINGRMESTIAEWDIEINNEAITTDEIKSIDITDIVWNANHVRAGKVAPGSTGVMQVEINPKSTDVAIRYELQVVDKTMNPDVVLRVTNISTNNTTLTKTAIDTYTGVLTLTDIRNGLKPHITFNIEWEDDPNINDYDRVIETADDYLLIRFKAYQYQGEQIIEYTGD